MRQLWENKRFQFSSMVSLWFPYDHFFDLTMISFYAPKKLVKSQMQSLWNLKGKNKRWIQLMVQKSGQILFRGRKTISSHNSINCDNQAKLETQVAFLTGVGDSDAVWNRLNCRKIVSRHHGTSWQCRWGDIEEMRKRIGNFVEKEQVSPDSWISCKLEETTILTNWKSSNWLKLRTPHCNYNKRRRSTKKCIDWHPNSQASQGLV